MREKLVEYDRFFSHNVIALGRMVGIGVMSREDAISYAVTGPAGRGSGWSCDIRKHQPYSMYSKVDFKEVIRTEGDSYARYMNRLDEIEESLHIIEQLIDNIPEGKTMLMKPAKKIIIPQGLFYSNLETARGVLGVFIASDGVSDKPVRVHMCSPNYNNLWSLDRMARGSRVGDLIAIVSSLDLVIPDIDR